MSNVLVLYVAFRQSPRYIHSPFFSLVLVHICTPTHLSLAASLQITSLIVQLALPCLALPCPVLRIELPLSDIMMMMMMTMMIGGICVAYSLVM